MTREKAKELLPIIQAFVEGKTIQVWANDTWQDEESPLFWAYAQFRIKPELKYRPFKTQEECWNEMLKHQPFGWIRNNNTQNLCNVEFIGYNNYSVSIKNSILHFDYAFNTYNFVDGTPFGIKMKQEKTD